MLHTASKLAKLLVEAGCIQYGIFKLSSGRKSDYYLDLRRVPSFPKVFEAVIEAYRKVILQVGRENFELISGIPTTGLLYAPVLAYKLKVPMIYVRNERKEYGLGKLVEGIYREGDRVLLIDDVATTGQNIMDSAEKLRSSGCLVEHALVLIDRQEGAAEMLAKKGIKLYSILSASYLKRYDHKAMTTYYMR